MKPPPGVAVRLETLPVVAPGAIETGDALRENGGVAVQIEVLGNGMAKAAEDELGEGVVGRIGMWVKSC